MKFNKLIPELSVADLEKSLRFYIEILGFKVEFERVEDKFAFVSYEGSQIMLEQDNGGWMTGEISYPRGRGINFEIETGELDALAEKIEKKGVEFFRKPQRTSYRTGENSEIVEEFLIQDPDGYLLRFQQTLK